MENKILEAIEKKESVLYDKEWMCPICGEAGFYWKDMAKFHCQKDPDDYDDNEYGRDYCDPDHWGWDD